MAIANPRIYIICGIYGNNKSFTYKVKTEINDDTNKEYQNVTLYCNNCSSITDIDELMEKDKL